MDWENKVRKMPYEEALEKLVRTCNMHNLRLYKHTDNYILGSAICVLSKSILDLGMPYITLSNEKDHNDKRWYLSIDHYQIFINL